VSVLSNDVGVLSLFDMIVVGLSLISTLCSSFIGSVAVVTCSLKRSNGISM